MNLFRKKKSMDSLDSESSLAKCLTLFDLTCLGVGAIIGAGIFVLTGIVAATHAGPAVVFSYILAGIACAFAALSYAELASTIGGCGSAYGYAYVGFGELLAWIVGWDLLLEYSISVSAVSVGWSGYAHDFFKAINVDFPMHLSLGTLSVNPLAPTIILLLAILLIIGVKSSSRLNNLMVLVKLSVIFLFIAIASFDVKVANWSPFMPFGWAGVAQGASLIFFAYIGFDAVSTAAEEAINPQRDLPKSIIGSLLICTLLYVIVSGLLTGIANYTTLNVASPISHALLVLGHKTAAGLVGVGAIAGLTTVMLVFYYGLTRVFLAMSRDGLLPKVFAKTNRITKTPIRIIVPCWLIISVFSALVPMHELAELVNIGTLFAFCIVCAGALYLHYKQPNLHRPFKTPGMPFIPVLGILSCLYLIVNLPWLTMIRFLIWMTLGLVVYFCFSYYHSIEANSR